MSNELFPDDYTNFDVKSALFAAKVRRVFSHLAMTKHTLTGNARRARYHTARKEIETSHIIKLKQLLK